MGPALDDAAVVEDEDQVRRQHGGQPVRDDERRAALEQLVQRGPDELLGQGVEVGRRLVQDQDARVLEDRPRDRYALLLATGQAVPALADDGLVAVRQRADELVEVRVARGGEELRLARGRVGVGVPLSPIPGIETRSWAALRTARLAPAERRVHARIVRALAAGSAPGGAQVTAWAREEGLAAEDVRAALVAADLAHVDADTGAVRLSYPFSAAPTRHRVSVDGIGESYAMCSLDSLGVAFMLRSPANVASSDPLTDERIEISVAPDGQASWSPRDAVAVVGRASGGGASAECMCPNTNFAVSPASAQAQLETLPDRSGTVMPMPDAIDAGRQLFGTLLHPGS
jgi:Alkylmercury lyase